MNYWSNEPLPTSSFTMTGMEPGKTRHLQFLHEGKKLAGSLEVKGDQTTPATVTLVPWGTLTGRLVDADGLPRKDAQLVFEEAPPGAPRAGHLRGNGAGMSGRIIPDDSGRFRIEGLAPGLSYSLGLEDKTMIRSKHVVKGVVIQPGETRDLGDVHAK